MNLPVLYFHLTNNSFLKIKSDLRILLLLFIALVSLLFLSSCASSKKFSSDETYSHVTSVGLRLMLQEKFDTISFTAEKPVKLYNAEKLIALVKTGNRIIILVNQGQVSISIGSQTFTSSSFRFGPADLKSLISFNNKDYRGQIQVTSSGKVVNIIQLEDYLKGVLPAEMPAGKGNENFEALKAMAICARTYTMMKLNEKKPDFDLYVDVRDQVYSGAGTEKEITNKAVDETAGIILQYNGAPAVIFYHASCGGFTEDGGNVFAGGAKPYLVSAPDADEDGTPFCSITPKFQWEEVYSNEGFAERFVKAGLLPAAVNKVISAEINSRFSSGRVNELILKFISDAGESKQVSITGNQIRSIIRTADNKGILRSTMFNIQLSDSVVTINGKGYGHGVGLCQWGAIARSRKGQSFQQILQHYFPGIEINTME